MFLYVGFVHMFGFNKHLIINMIMIQAFYWELSDRQVDFLFQLSEPFPPTTVAGVPNRNFPRHGTITFVVFKSQMSKTYIYRNSSLIRLIARTINYNYLNSATFQFAS